MILYVWKMIYDPHDMAVLPRYEKTAVIANAASVIWVSRYCAAGQFEICMPADRQMLALFQSDELLITRDGIRTAMIPERIELTAGANGGDMLTVSGRSAESLLGRRVVPSQWTFSGTAEDCVRKLVTDNFLSPADASRRFRLMVLGDRLGVGSAISRQVTGGNLLEIIPEICAPDRLGIRMEFDGTQFIFSLYRGADRSWDQSERPRAVFSEALGNLAETTYIRDISANYNCAYCAGEGEGKNRTIAFAQASGIGVIGGERRRELWVDARNTSSNGGEIPYGEYNMQLFRQAKEALDAARPAVTYSGRITERTQTAQDYALGDLAAVENRWGIRGSAVITGIAEAEDASGYRRYPELSEWTASEVNT